MKSVPSHPLSTRLALLAAAGTLLAGCAMRAPAPAAEPPAAGAIAAQGSAPAISVPPTSVGTWYDLGAHQAPWMAGDAPVPVDGANAPTRIAGLQREEDGRWMALVITQMAPVAAPCPAPTTLTLPTRARDGCLRMRRNADFDGWLKNQSAVLWRWLDARGLTSTPREWIAYRAGNLEVHALVDPSLLEPQSRTNEEFLSGGQPGHRWAQQFAAAARAAGGVLTVPPFPFAPTLAAPPAPAASKPVVTAPAPTRAEQVRPRPPVLAPRKDRE